METKVTEAWLMREFTARAKACQLTIDCLGAGDVNSKIAIIGEAPSESDSKMKMPFVGGAGKLLWDTLRPLELTRKDFYVTNVCKKQVTFSSQVDAKNPIKKVEIAHWEGLLDWELDNLPNLQYVLALGNFALHALTGELGINKWRGSVFDCKVGRSGRVVKVICTNNPGHIMRSLAMEPMYRFDIAKLRRVLDGKFKKHVVTARINPTIREANEFLDELDRDDAPIALDIEVIANETACIGFANNAYTGMCINFRDAKTNRFSLEEERILRDRIQQFLHNRKNKFIAQNGSLHITRFIRGCLITLAISQHNTLTILITKTKVRHGERVVMSINSGIIMSKIVASHGLFMKLFIRNSKPRSLTSFTFPTYKDCNHT
mgnify:CR=1 FL=1